MLLQRWHSVIGRIEVALNRVVWLVFHGADDQDCGDKCEELNKRKHDEHNANQMKVREHPVIDLFEAAVPVDIVAVKKIGFARVVDDTVSPLRLTAGSRDFAWIRKIKIALVAKSLLFPSDDPVREWLSQRAKMT